MQDRSQGGLKTKQAQKKYAFIDYNEYSQAERSIKELNGTNLNSYNTHLQEKEQCNSKCNIEWSKKVDPATGDRKNDSAHTRYTKAKLGDLCFNCGEKGHFVKNCPFTYQQIIVRRKIECFKCKSEGHIAKDCPYIQDDPEEDEKESGAGGHYKKMEQTSSLLHQESYNSRQGSADFGIDGLSAVLQNQIKSFKQSKGGNNDYVPHQPVEVNKKGGIPTYKAHTFREDKLQDNKIVKQVIDRLADINSDVQLISVQQNMQPYELIEYQMPSNEPRFIAEIPEDLDKITDYSISELKKKLRSVGQATSGTKFQLIERLRDFMSLQIN